MRVRNWAKGAVVALAIAMVGATAYAGTLEDVQSAGVLKCGINTGLVGFASTDDDGNWVGFDVAYCRALAAAVLGDRRQDSVREPDRREPLPGAAGR